MLKVKEHLDLLLSSYRAEMQYSVTEYVQYSDILLHLYWDTMTASHRPVCLQGEFSVSFLVFWLSY